MKEFIAEKQNEEDKLFFQDLQTDLTNSTVASHIIRNVQRTSNKSKEEHKEANKARNNEEHKMEVLKQRVFTCSNDNFMG